MRRVIWINQENEEIVDLSSIKEHVPIFAKRNGKLSGMVVFEMDKGWILKIGGKSGCSGYFEHRESCLSSGNNYGYKFYVV